MKLNIIAYDEDKDGKCFYYGIENGNPVKYQTLSGSFGYKMDEVIDLVGNFVYIASGSRYHITKSEYRFARKLVNDVENPSVLSNDIFKL